MTRSGDPDSRPTEYSFARYLSAKESVDDRALHRPTLDRLSGDLARLAADRSGPLRVLEVGCGLGSMLRRLVDRGRLPTPLDYLGVDADPSLIEGARERTRAWLAGATNGDGRPTESSPAGDRPSGGATPDDALVGRRRDGRVAVRFRAADAFEVVAGADDDWDLVIAAAFLDVVDAARAVHELSAVGGGRLYAPITFDGVTAFEPTAPSTDASASEHADGPGVDETVIDAYHATMRGPDRGGPETGRSLFRLVGDAGATVRAAGGSDWVVHPPYPDDEAYFLHHLVHTVESAVLTALDDGTLSTAGVDPDLGPDAVRAWADSRHRAVADGSLAYLAHNVDLYAIRD